MDEELRPVDHQGVKMNVMQFSGGIFLYREVPQDATVPAFHSGGFTPKGFKGTLRSHEDFAQQEKNGEVIRVGLVDNPHKATRELMDALETVFE